MSQFQFYGEIPAHTITLPLSRVEISVPATGGLFTIEAPSLGEAREKIGDDFYSVDFVREVT